MQYNFRKVDEDTLGKAYETFLAEVRKEQGIYYTPPYVTEYITKNAVGVLFDDLIKQIKSAIEKEDFEKAKEYVNKFTEIRVLDPACGSGSFLIKAIRLIWGKYQDLNGILNDCNSIKKREKQDNKGLDKYEDDKRIRELKKILSLGDNRLLISKIILRHIHGNDLDKKALDVAKVNIWLEAIKLSPKDFKWQNLPRETNHILPNLEMNFGNGDSLVGLPEKETIEYLQNNHKEELIKLFKLRDGYLEDPTNPDLVMEIENILFGLRKEIDKRFKEYLKVNKLPEEILQVTIPFHWALEFWYNFMENKSMDKIKGFDVIVGNPPYDVLIEVKERKDLISKLKYFSKDDTYRNYLFGGRKNLYWLFIIRSRYLLKQNGFFSFINPSTLLCDDTTQGLRKLLIDKFSLREIIEFPEKARVFKDVIQAVVIFVSRNCSKEKNIKVAYEVDGEEGLRDIKFININKDLLNKFTNSLAFPLRLDKVTLDILDKIHENSRLEKNYLAYQGEANLTFYKNFFTDNNTGTNLIRGEHVYEPYLTDTPLDTKWKYIRRTEFEREISQKKKDNSKKYRIITQQVSNMGLKDRLKASIATPKDIVGNSCNCVIPNDNNENINYILSIINSSIMEFRFKLFSTNNHINTYELNELPIVKYDPQKISYLKYIEKIIIYKKVRKKLIQIIDVLITKLKNHEYTLHHLLTNDLRETREGNFKNTWTSKVTFYPNGNDEKLKQEYTKFKINQDTKNSSIKIYGLKEDGSHNEVYEMIFTKKELMQLIYFVLHSTLNSRSRIKNLDSLFKKAIVPVIVPQGYNPSDPHVFQKLVRYPQHYKKMQELTINIVEKIQQEFTDWLKKEGIKERVSADLGEIEKQIQETDNLIDAYVFKLYDLNKEEINTVLGSLKVEPDIKEDILEKFQEIKNKIKK